MFSLTEYLNVGNVLLAALLLLLLHQFVELYDFRDMPPGPRFPVLPIVGHALHFDFNAESFGEAIRRSVVLLLLPQLRICLTTRAMPSK